MARFINETKGTVIADKGIIASSPAARAQGLLGKDNIKPGEGLLITPCSSIHTFFMHFAIDVIYLDSEHRVVKLVESLKPWRISVGGKGSKEVIEVPVLTIRNTKTELGDRIKIEE